MSLEKLIDILPPLTKKNHIQEKVATPKINVNSKQQANLPDIESEEQKSSNAKSSLSWISERINSMFDKLEKGLLDYSVNLVEDCPSYYNPMHGKGCSVGRSKSGFFYKEVNNTCIPISTVSVGNGAWLR
jgi:hypothetical protein